MADDTTNTTGTNIGWGEDTSTHFLELGDVYVPIRSEQIATLLGLIPAGSHDTFAAAELGAGGGKLARAVLDAFPRCAYFALDGSDVMRRRLRDQLAPYGERATVDAFTLQESAWRAALPRPLHVVLSSLVVHHLTGDEKRALYADLAGRIEPGGALLIADVIEPPNARAASVFARQWDDAARRQSQDLTGKLDAFSRFQADGWNFYGTGEDDPIDHPSRLFDQLQWLRAAGFRDVDCFWMHAGHAIYGGYR
jgi:hypothetical protein